MKQEDVTLLTWIGTMLTLVIMTGVIAFNQSTIIDKLDYATVGGTEVPRSLECEEDEVIGWLGVDTLGCVHVEEIGERSQ